MSVEAWALEGDGWLRSRLRFDSEAERAAAMAQRQDLIDAPEPPECGPRARARWTGQAWACQAWPPPEQAREAERATARAAYERRAAAGVAWRGARLAGDADSVARLMLLRDAAADPTSGFRAAGEPVRLADGSWATMRRAEVIDAWTALRDRLLLLNREHATRDDEGAPRPGARP